MTSETLLKNDYGQADLFQYSDDIQAIKFDHQNSKGAVSLHGGQVLSWQPKGQQQVFWLSENSHYSSSSAIRGGIPLCWPWFGGDVKSVSGEIVKASNHGFARQSLWHLDDISISAENVTIVLSLAGQQYSSFWPSAFKLTQKLVFATEFQQTLTMANLSEHSVEYTGALHSYFCVGDPEQVTVNELDLYRYDDKLTGQQHQLSTLVHCMGPIDRIYHDNQSKTIIDNKWKRTITIDSVNCQQWVLWNPGREAVASMADMHQGSEQEFVCLEAANTQWQKIASQESVSISQRVSIEAL